MFEPSTTDFWESVSKKSGAHYNNYGCRDEQRNGMSALRQIFPSGKADEMNFCLFSTSGVHGMYTTIEEAEHAYTLRLIGEKDESGEEYGEPSVTFLIVHPRICCLRHGNCYPQNTEDFDYLKTLRASSWEAVKEIGAHVVESTSVL